MKTLEELLFDYTRGDKTLEETNQALMGGGVITLAELGAGLILNVWLKLDIWDYSRLPGNLWGQVCLKYALLWVVLAGTAIVLFDWMRHWLFHEERPHYRWI